MSWTTDQLKDHPRRDQLTGIKTPPAVPLAEQFRLEAEPNEKKLQETICGMFDRANPPIPYERKRMDKPSTGVVGCPDFIACLPGGKYLAIECKVGTNDLSEKQNDFRNKVKMNDGLWMTVWESESVRQILNAYREAKAIDPVAEKAAFIAGARAGLDCGPLWNDTEKLWADYLKANGRAHCL